jgi:iron complex outermembrane receptor protein
MKISSTMKLTILSVVASSTLFGADSKETDKVLEKVTVTANKIEENIQDIPQSITVLDAQMIKEKGITDIVGVIKEIPNMTDIPDHGTAVNFRGLNASLFTNNNPVVVYIDGVPTTDRYGYDISTANIQRIEVLRGPQGTLYGKDAIGAVINIITKTPTNEVSGSIGVEYGSDNHQLATFNVNAPITNNKLYFGINAHLEKNDGWITNSLTSDDKANKKEEKKFSTYLLYKPSDKLSTKLTLSKNESEHNWMDGYALASGSELSSFKRDTAKNYAFDVPTFENSTVDSQSFNIKYDFKDIVLNAVTTHKKLDFDSEFDQDFGNDSSYSGLKQFNYTNKDEWTQELRLSKATDDVKIVGGIYLDKEDREQGPYGQQYNNANTAYQMNAISTSDSSTKTLFAIIGTLSATKA